MHNAPNSKAGETRSLAERLWAKVNGPWFGDVGADDCWLWFGAAETGPYRVLPDGSRVKKQKRFRYGRIHVERRRLVGVHRVAYELLVGPVPEGHVVMHSCDRTLCCNPRHLVTGTQADNIADMYAKGRGARGRVSVLPEDERWAS